MTSLKKIRIQPISPEVHILMTLEKNPHDTVFNALFEALRGFLLYDLKTHGLEKWRSQLTQLLCFNEEEDFVLMILLNLMIF